MRNTFYLPNSLRSALGWAQRVCMLFLLCALYLAVYPGSILSACLHGLLAGLFITGLEGFRFGESRVFDLAVAQSLGLLLAGGITWLQLCLAAGRLLSPLPMIALILFQGFAAWGMTRLFHFSHKKLFQPVKTALVCGSDSDPIPEYGDACFRSEEDVSSLCRKLEAFQAVTLSAVTEPQRSHIMKYCYQKGIPVYVIPEVTDVLLRFGKTVTASHTPMILVRGSGLTLGQRFRKRAMDITLTLLAMIPAAPIMAAVAIAIRLEDGGPVFYRQKRLTRGGREFEILKFRSMIPDAEKYTGAVLASQNDPRITRTGRFIRATRLDELPQLLNILRGDMSIVGPRPERREIAESFARELPEFDYRLKVRGGLTGYAQIYGKYNTTPAHKLRLDLIYMERYSLLLDIRLMLLTLRILFSRESTEGVAQKEEAKCS